MTTNGCGFDVASTGGERSCGAAEVGVEKGIRETGQKSTCGNAVGDQGGVGEVRGGRWRMPVGSVAVE